MIVEVDASSPVPPYRQLHDQITAMIVAGTLPEGHRLPSIRQLAGDLELAPGTVARAYRQLETAGWVVAAGRRGTRVAPRDRRPPSTPDDVDHRLREAARTYATATRQLGVDAEVALEALRRELDPLRSEPPR